MFNEPVDKTTKHKILTDKRCARSRVNIDSRDILKDVLPDQFRYSKFVANQAIYGNRQWYAIHHIFVDHIYKNIGKNIKLLSTNDKLTLLNIADKKRDLKTIGIILAHIRTWEYESFSDMETKIYESYSEEELNIMENIVKQRPVEFIKSPIIEYDKRTLKMWLIL